MNAQEMERRFLGNFIHTLPPNEQVSWLEMQPEIKQALSARANGETWMTTPFINALDSACRARVIQAERAAEREQIANSFTVAAILREVSLPHGIVVTISPRDIPLDTSLERGVTLQFLAGSSVIARYKLDPKLGKGKLCAAYKKFVREHLAARIANCAAIA